MYGSSLNPLVQPIDLTPTVRADRFAHLPCVVPSFPLESPREPHASMGSNAHRPLSPVRAQALLLPSR